jgi:ketosteroid isomerase-like protein
MSIDSTAPPRMPLARTSRSTALSVTGTTVLPPGGISATPTGAFIMSEKTKQSGTQHDKSADTADGLVADTMRVGRELVDMCRQGQMLDAIDSFYSPDIVSIEAVDNPTFARRIEGFEAVRGKSETWDQNNEVHSVEVEGPWPHDDRFIVRFRLDVTPKAGPMAGQRMTIDETGLYTVEDGKIVQEEFFYNTDG